MAGVELLVAYAFFDYSSDEEDYDLLPVNTLLRRENVPRINLYVENVVGAMSDRDFASHFRLNRSCIRSIETMIMTDTLFHCIGGCVWKQLLMTLWILATPDSYRSVDDRFDVSKSTLWLAFKETVSAVARLSPTIIRFPTVADMPESEMRFRGMSSFPGVIGCIDGTHIEIKAPQTMPESYVNRNSFYSVILQRVANSRMEFIHCYAGEVGSVHDARVYRKSKIGQQITTLMPGNYHLLGDGAYPLQLNLITPFKNNGHLTRRQLNFNRKLSATRCVIERAFGQLKGRFRRLKYLDMNRTDFIPSVIMACCVLHNLGLRQAIDDITIDVEDVNDDDSSDDSGNLQNLQSFAAVAKRDSIMNSL